MPEADDDKPPAGVFLKLTEADQTAIKKLISIEPDLTKIIEGKRAWSILTEILKKIAIFLTTISGGFFVLREIVKVIQG